MDEQFIKVLYTALGALGVKSKEQFEQGLQLLGEDGISTVYQLYQQNPDDIEGIAKTCAQIIQKKQLGVVAKMGAQLNYINSLRGKCPEGFEVEKFLAGGCVKCKKKSKGGDVKFEAKNRFKKPEKMSGGTSKGGVKVVKHNIKENELSGEVTETRTGSDGTTAKRIYDADGASTTYVGRRGERATVFAGDTGVSKKVRKAVAMQDSLEKADWSSKNWKSLPAKSSKKPSKKTIKRSNGGIVIADNDMPWFVSDYKSCN